MATGIGERLRDARTARGLDLEEVEERTKIRARYLRAMEEERWELLPGAAYARGFLHTYAEVVGLDADAVVDEYRRGEGSQEPEPEAAPGPQLASAERRGPRLPGRAAGRARLGRGTIAGVALAALLGILLVLGLLGDSEEEKEAGAPAERPAPADSGERRTASVPAKTPAGRPSRVTLRLTATGTVWVCLVDRTNDPWSRE